MKENKPIEIRRYILGRISEAINEVDKFEYYVAPLAVIVFVEPGDVCHMDKFPFGE